MAGRDKDHVPMYFCTFVPGTPVHGLPSPPQFPGGHRLSHYCGFSSGICSPSSLSPKLRFQVPAAASRTSSLLIKTLDLPISRNFLEATLSYLQTIQNTPQSVLPGPREAHYITYQSLFLFSEAAFCREDYRLSYTPLSVCPDTDCPDRRGTPSQCFSTDLSFGGS